MTAQPGGSVRLYPAYKESGAHPIGRIPAHWETVRLTGVFSVVSGSTPESGVADYWDGDIPWVTPEDLGDLTGPQIVRTRRRITQAGYKSCATRLVPSGSLVLSTRAPIGHLGIAGTPLCTNQGCRCLVFRRHASTRFFYYQLAARRRDIESLGQGSTFKELQTEKLRSVVLVEPPVDEQALIAAFLDRETAKIDVLIAKKERLIELLQEKRNELVTRAVSRGLDANVPMRDSGIEWLAEVPEHWQVLPNASLFRERDARGQGDLPLLEVSIRAGVQVRQFAEDRIETRAADSTTYKIARRGDLAFNKMRMWQGAVGVAAHDGLVSSDYIVAEPTHRANSSYYASLFRTSNYMAEVYRNSHGIADDRNRLYWEDFKMLKSPTPPRDEQEHIVRYLHAETARVDELMSAVGRAIAALRGLRIALIGAAVTGKIDVREAAAV